LGRSFVHHTWNRAVREREREREGQEGTLHEIPIQTLTQTRHLHKYTQRHRQADRQTDEQRHRDTEWQAGIDNSIHKQTGIYTTRYTHKHTHTHTHRHIDFTNLSIEPQEFTESPPTGDFDSTVANAHQIELRRRIASENLQTYRQQPSTLTTTHHTDRQATVQPHQRVRSTYCGFGAWVGRHR
jgi:superfamily II RNA helicase